MRRMKTDRVLMYEKKGHSVRIGDTVTLISNEDDTPSTPVEEVVTITDMREPHKPGSTGRVEVEYAPDDNSRAIKMEYFPGVIDAVWKTYLDTARMCPKCGVVFSNEFVVGPDMCSVCMQSQTVRLVFLTGKIFYEGQVAGFTLMLDGIPSLPGSYYSNSRQRDDALLVALAQVYWLCPRCQTPRSFDECIQIDPDIPATDPRSVMCPTCWEAI